MTEELRKQLVLPRHVGIIMDGNGRWASARGLDRSEGHKAGAETFRTICNYGADLGIEAMTFYAFSTENWKRPPKEVRAIMSLFRDFLDEADEREAENEKRGLRFRLIGEKNGLPADIVSKMDRLEKGTADRKVMTVNLAVNYGGRDEITRAVRRIAEAVKRGDTDPRKITEETVGDNLFTAGQPDPDLIIRPGGECRLSNFMIWQAAYSEFWFSDILWPDFTTDDFDRAILDFCRRNRRMGGV